jgi:hypothetical protein
MYDQAFLMAGTASRMTQALQLNLESDRDILCVIREPNRLSPLEKEIRRRLMWAVYLADANIASGVNQLKLIIAEDLKVQLPTHDHNFLHQVPAITQRVHMFGSNSEGLPLPPVERPDSGQAQSQMGLQAYFIRMRYVKSQILSYIKKVSNGLPPWDDLYFRVFRTIWIRYVRAFLPLFNTQRHQSAYTKALLTWQRFMRFIWESISATAISTDLEYQRPVFRRSPSPSF